jgi:hypothetical protein
MKTFYTIFALVFSLNFYAQNFKDSTDYSIADIKNNTDKTDPKNKELNVYLFKDDEVLAQLVDLTTEDLEHYYGTTIQVLESPELDNIKAVIKVEFEFLEGCTNYETHYFLQTNDDVLIKLPTLDYMHCEYATSKIEYRFPNQDYGQDNAIILTESFLDEHQNVESVNVIKTIVWEEKDPIQEYSYNYEN